MRLQAIMKKASPSRNWVAELDVTPGVRHPSPSCSDRAVWGPSIEEVKG